MHFGILITLRVKCKAFLGTALGCHFSFCSPTPLWFLFPGAARFTEVLFVLLLVLLLSVWVGHTWQCQEFTPGSVLGTFLVVLREPHGVPRIKPNSAACKASVPPTAVFLQVLLFTPKPCIPSLPTAWMDAILRWFHANLYPGSPPQSLYHSI